MVAFKAYEEESWQYSFPEDILAEYTLALPPQGNPLRGILELTSAGSLVIEDMSNPQLKTSMYKIDLLLTDTSGNERTERVTLAIREPIALPSLPSETDEGQQAGSDP